MSYCDSATTHYWFARDSDFHSTSISMTVTLNLLQYHVSLFSYLGPLAAWLFAPDPINCCICVSTSLVATCCCSRCACKSLLFWYRFTVCCHSTHPINVRKKGAKAHMGMNHGKGIGPILWSSALMGSARCWNFSVGILAVYRRILCMYYAFGFRKVRSKKGRLLLNECKWSWHECVESDFSVFVHNS